MLKELFIHLDMTLVVLNNLLYGMTGGQMSGLSTNEFKEYKYVDDTAEPYDVVNLAYQSGASYSVRVNNIQNFNAVLKEAIATKGFSLVEMSSLCTSHGMKKVSEFKNYIVEEEVFKNKRPVGKALKKKTTSLFDKLQGLDKTFDANLDTRIGIVIGGSAGGGVQSAAKILAEAGILAGLHTTMKGEYPITVGTGFSAAEVILSKEPINYTGLERPDVVLAVTDEGWNKVKPRISKNSNVFTDSSLETDFNFRNFIKEGGKKGAALSAVAYWVKESGIFPVESLLEVVKNSKYADALINAIESSYKL